MYQNPYMTNYPVAYNQQNITDRIDNQIAQLQQMKEQMKQSGGQSGGITQNFQLAPTQSGIRYANTIDDVNKETIFIDTPFFSKDMSVLWVKNPKGEIKTYELNEIIAKDEKDLKIDFLMAQISELKKEMSENAKPNNANVDGTVESEKPTNVQTVSKSSKKSK